MEPRTLVLTLLLILGCAGSAYATQGTDSINAVLGDESWHRGHGELPDERTDEVVRIRTHLYFVTDLLQAADTGHLTRAQRSRRSASLRHLRTYADDGVFPQRDLGDGYEERRPQFIDARGVHCAVGELIRHSGHAELAEEIDAHWELAYVVDIDSPALADWAQEHGFTTHELAMIQPTYHPPTTIETVDHVVGRFSDDLVIDCSRSGDPIPERISVEVSGDADGDITVDPVSEPTPFATCFAKSLAARLRGMKKIKASAFSKTFEIEPPKPAELARDRLGRVSARRCKSIAGVTPARAKLRAKSGEGQFEVFAESTPENDKVDACLRNQITTALSHFRKGHLTFDVSVERQFGARVTRQGLELGVQTASAVAPSVCKDGPKKFTVKASVKKGDTAVAVQTEGGDETSEKCISDLISKIVTKSLLRTTSDEVLPSDGDAEVSYTYESPF